MPEPAASAPAPIEAADWSGTATANAVAQLLSFSGGSQASNAFSAAGLGAIDKGGRTQLRLRFASDHTATPTCGSTAARARS